MTEDALQPRSFNIRIKQGNFALPMALHNQPDAKKEYIKHLVFDILPYSSKSDWEKGWFGMWFDPDDVNYWD